MSSWLLPVRFSALCRTVCSVASCSQYKQGRWREKKSAFLCQNLVCNVLLPLRNSLLGLYGFVVKTLTQSEVLLVFISFYNSYPPRPPLPFFSKLPGLSGVFASSAPWMFKPAAAGVRRELTGRQRMKSREITLVAETARRRGCERLVWGTRTAQNIVLHPPCRPARHSGCWQATSWLM